VQLLDLAFCFHLVLIHTHMRARVCVNATSTASHQGFEHRPKYDKEFCSVNSTIITLTCSRDTQFEHRRGHQVHRHRFSVLLTRDDNSNVCSRDTQFEHRRGHQMHCHRFSVLLARDNNSNVCSRDTQFEHRRGHQMHCHRFSVLLTRDNNSNVCSRMNKYNNPLFVTSNNELYNNPSFATMFQCVLLTT
jgi:hypothetical protein